MLVFATVLFAVQIYCDFGGYSHIAIGAAQVLGIRPMDNFRQPYFAVNCREFWRRWHISLSSWFRDYLYFPLGGSRGSSGRTAVNPMITFLVSGLWHGAGWHYVVWGAIHGSYQVAGRGIRYVSEAAQKRLPEKKIRFFSEKMQGLTRATRICVTFILTDFAWLFSWQIIWDELWRCFGGLCKMVTGWDSLPMAHYLAWGFADWRCISWHLPSEFCL